MNRFIRRWILFLLSLPLVLISVSAEGGSVFCDGIAADCILEPEGTARPTKLFGGFGSIRAGDMLVDRVLIRGGSAGSGEVSLYIRSDSPDAEARDYCLSQITLDIRTATGRRIFYGTAEKSAQWIFLGTLPAGQQELLELTLWMPPRWDENLQNVMDAVNWRFLAVGSTSPEPLPEEADPIPQTGGGLPPLLCAALLVYSTVGLWLCLQKRHSQQ